MPRSPRGTKTWWVADVDKIKELMQKKVGGVPVLYLIAAGVLVLAIYAWRMKPQADFTDDNSDVQGDAESASTLPDEGGSAYDSLATQGTVTVVQQPSTSTQPSTEKTNSDWVKEGAEWAVLPTSGLNVSGAEANQALSLYLQGADLNYAQTQIVNAVTKEKGQPPDGVGATGKLTLTAPDAAATRQVTSFPGWHTVKGSNDNTYNKLCRLYYGNDSQATLDTMQYHNVMRVGTGGTFAPGTRIYIPEQRSPKLFVTTKSVHTSQQIAAKNGISTAQLIALNNTERGNWPVGVAVRVY